jgi:hypothetical protein
MGQGGNPGVPLHAHELVALVAVVALAVSVDLTLHETRLQTERYALERNSERGVCVRGAGRKGKYRGPCHGRQFGGGARGLC